MARAGSGPLHIAICAEYDCLPGIGHACGHNLIAAMAVGAGIAAARVADEVGLTISVIGTPAEEVGNAGGKILLLERGAFAGMHAAMMVHPAPFDVVTPTITAAKYIIRAETLDRLAELRPKVQRCFEAGAIATGSRLELIGGDKPYTHMVHDRDMAAFYRRNAEAVGRRFAELGGQQERVAASTDMGNVSLALPAIQPAIGINSLPAVNHQPEFAAHCVSTAADQALLDGALAMAWTVIDVATDLRVRERLLAPA